MSPHRFHLSTPLLYLFTLFLSLIVLRPLNDRWTVGASPTPNLLSVLATKLHRRVSEGIPGPDVSDYPSDAVIYAICGEIPRDCSVMFTEIGDSFPAKYFAVLNGKKIYTDLFPEDPEPFTKMLGRSLKWYQDFADRYSRIFAERSSGDVFLVSNWPRGPQSRCSVWYRIEYPVLKMNPAVERVILVNKLNYYDQVEIWPVDRRSPEDQGGGDDDDPGGNPDPGNLEPGPDRPRLPGVSPVGLGIGLGLLLGGGAPALGSLVLPAINPGQLPALPVASDTPKYNPNGENLQDVVFGDSASLPGQDWNAFTGDGGPDGVNLAILPKEDGGSALHIAQADSSDDIFGDAPESSLFSANDNAGSTTYSLASTTDELFPTTDDQFFRRQSTTTLTARDASDGTCFDWSGSGDDPAQTPSNDPGWATIHVVQYQKSDQSPTYKLDLTLSKAATIKLVELLDVVAPDGEWINIQSPLPYRLFVMPGATDADPIRFRYGTYGVEWDSNDVGLHDCHLDEWRAGQRTGDCRFTY